MILYPRSGICPSSILASINESARSFGDVDSAQNAKNPMDLEDNECDDG